MKRYNTLLQITLINLLLLVNVTYGCPDDCKCVGHAVHCASQGLRTFPTNLPAGTIQLGMENNQIISLPSLILANQSQLHTITLHNNRIAYIMPRAFSSVSTLNYLDLSNNSLRMITRDVLSDLRSLSLLNLAKNKIITIAPTAFANLGSLRELFLSDNAISNLPLKIFSTLTNLKTLRLERNGILRIPDGVFQFLSSLTLLDISHNKLQRITSRTTDGLNKLHELHLQGNRIQNLDPQFLLPEQQCSELNDNSAEQKLESLHPGCFVNLRELRTIDLSNNSLSSIRYSTFSSLSQLSELYLNDNPWRCDCFLIWSLMRLSKDHGNDCLARGQMRCWEPEDLQRFPIEDLTIQDLSNLQDSDNKLAPQTNTIPPTDATKHSIGFLPLGEERRSSSENLNDLNRITGQYWTSIPVSETFGVSKFDHGHATAQNEVEMNKPFPLAQTSSPTVNQHPNPQTTPSTPPTALNRIELPREAPEWSPMPQEFPGLAPTPYTPERDTHVRKHVNETSNPRAEGKESGIDDARITQIAITGLQKDAEAMNIKGPSNPVNGTTKTAAYEDGTELIIGRDDVQNKLSSSSQQDDVISWLLVSAIFAGVFAVAICGAVALNKQFSQDGTRCGCCPTGKETTRSSTSESIRSISNYPLLYDNPLARRPLPRQPIQITREQGRSGQPIRASSPNGQVDIRWTCGGAFGIGDTDPSPSKFVAQRGGSRQGRNGGYPPVIPPRIPITAQNWSDSDDGVSWNPRLMSNSVQNICKSQYNRLHLPVSASVSFSDDRGYHYQGESVHGRKLHSNEQLCREQSREMRRRSHHEMQGNRRPGSTVGIEVVSQTNHFDLIRTDSAVQNDFIQSGSSAPVSRHNSEFNGATYRVSRRSEREHMVAQMLEALQEIETARRSSNTFELEKPYSHAEHILPDRKSAYLKDSPLVTQKYIPASIDRDCLLGSVQSRKQRRESQFHHAGGHKELWSHHKRPGNTKTSQSARNHASEAKTAGDDHVRFPKTSIARSQSINVSHSSHISDVDFEFPPPPPCAALSCSDDSQLCSSSVSEASYDLSLPPPPPHLNVPPTNKQPSYETPDSAHCNLDVENNSSQDDLQIYVSSGCSGDGKCLKTKLHNSGHVMKESEYKQQNEGSVKTKDWFARKESIDSMFVSMDSNCESLTVSDAEDCLPDTERTSREHDKSLDRPTTFNYQSEVKYRNPDKISNSNRLRMLKEEYRKSMPIYNELIRNAVGLSHNQRQLFIETSKRYMGSEKCLYSSVKPNTANEIDLMMNSHRLSHLELSCSESDLETIPTTPKAKPKKIWNMRSRSSSTGSTATITPLNEAHANRSTEKPSQDPVISNRNLQKAKLEYKASASSQGSESVSSIEFGEFYPGQPRPTNYNYQALDQMYSGRLPPENQSSGYQHLNASHRWQRSEEGTRSENNASRAGVAVLAQRDANFATADKRRCYFDVIESSADEVSTDIEMFDLGTM